MALDGLDNFDKSQDVGFIRHYSTSMNAGCEHLRLNMMLAKEALTGHGDMPEITLKGKGKGGADLVIPKRKAKAGDPGSPGLLAEFQVASSEYQLYRTAQTSFVKSITDLDKGILQKW